MTWFNTMIALFGTSCGVLGLTLGLVYGDPVGAAIGAFLLGWTWAGVVFLLGRG